MYDQLALYLKQESATSRNITLQSVPACAILPLCPSELLKRCLPKLDTHGKKEVFVTSIACFETQPQNSHHQRFKQQWTKERQRNS